MRQDYLYFIALIPDETIQKEVTEFKRYAKAHFQSKRALRSPPHVTLIPPFRKTVAEEKTLIQQLSDFRFEAKALRINLVNFSAFPPRVIYVDVEVTKELKLLEHALRIYLEAAWEQKIKSYDTYRPHMTVAFKDLKRHQFDAAWAYFSDQQYERIFEANSFFLLRHEEKQWNVFKEFKLKRHDKRSERD